jgi:hypothetical protein
LQGLLSQRLLFSLWSSIFKERLELQKNKNSYVILVGLQGNCGNSPNLSSCIFGIPIWQFSRFSNHCHTRNAHLFLVSPQDSAWSAWNTWFSQFDLYNLTGSQLLYKPQVNSY